MTVLNANNILAALTKSAALLAADMKTRTSSGDYPGRSDRYEALSDSIVVEPATQIGENKFKVSIIVKHPAAAAFEFGSGIHSTRGVAGTYEIRPRNSSVLVFPWQPNYVPWGSRKFAGVQLSDPTSTEGTYYFNYVDHPGIAPKPFVSPSIAAKKAEIFKIIGQAFRASIRINDRYEEEIK